MPAHKVPADERFWAKVNKTDDCWLWTGAKMRRGQGAFHVEGKRQAHAHRYLWESINGPVPDGLQLDHLCRNPSCVRPDHLEPVTPGENVRRGRLVALRDATFVNNNASKTACPRGHLYDLFTPRGRGCSTCRNAYNARYREKVRAARA